MQNKIISKGHEARLRVKQGIDMGADAIRPTLGAIGMTAVIECPGLDPIECDDAITILKHLQFKDRHNNIGLNKLRKASLTTSEKVGDATATTATLAQAITHEAFKEVANDSSKVREVRDRLTAGLKNTIEELGKMRHEITMDDIEKVAMISSLDSEVSKLISDIIKEVGINGVVTVEKGAKLGYSKEIVKGARFDRGLISPFFINQSETESTVLEDAYIILVDRKVSTNEQILSLLNSIGTGKDILFIADDVDSVALATLAQNAVNKIADIACVRNPYSASRARDFLFDIAALTGATVISEEMGMRLDTSTVSVCGHAEKVIVTKDSTTIIGGKANEALKTRIEAIQTKISETTSEYEKSILEDRLACLTGGIGVIRVGTYNDAEFNTKKYKFDNAINTAQSALAEGIVAGGGVALCSVASKIQDPMFKYSLVVPYHQMAFNAGMLRRNRLQRILGLKKKIVSSCDGQTGFNFITKKRVNMFDEGIIDSFQSVRMALENAVQVAYDTIGYEIAITEENENK